MVRSNRPIVSGAASAAMLIAFCGGATAGVLTKAHWLSPTSGWWSNAHEWDTGFVPQNGVPAGVTYHVIIDAHGEAPYEVRLWDGDVTIDALTVESEQATLEIIDSEFRVADVKLNAGDVRLLRTSVRGGVWTLNGGQLLVDDQVRLYGTQVFGDLVIAIPSGAVHLHQGAAIHGDVSLSGSATRLLIRQDFTLPAGRRIDLKDTWGFANVGIKGNQTLTVEPGAYIGGAGQIHDLVTSADGTLVNRGLIESRKSESSSNLDLEIWLRHFTNEGTLRAGEFSDIDIRSPHSGVFENNGLCVATKAAEIHFERAVFNGAGGSMRLEIAGSAVEGPFAEFGRFWLYEPSQIDGEDLEIALIDGFEPQWGDSFAVIGTRELGSLSGDLSGITLPALSDASLRWWLAQSEAGLTIGVSHVADVDHDGVVGFADLNLLLSSFSSPGAWEQGDVDGDGSVGFADLNILLAAMNATAP